MGRENIADDIQRGMEREPMIEKSASRFAGAIAVAGLLASLPLAAAAQQFFKCPQPDGSTKFQDSPCPGTVKAHTTAPANNGPQGVSSTKDEPYYDPYSPANVSQRLAPMHVPTNNAPVAPAAAPPAPAEQARRVATPRGAPPVQAPARSPEQERIDQENAKTMAYNKSIRCDHARQQLGVATSERPVYSLDNKGERHYVEDADRDNMIKNAQRRVDEECR
jgi:hypothetical protein